MMRKWIMRALCILCLAAMLTGCGREPEVTETTIEVKKNGQVVHTIIEDFSESYYNLDELESTIQQFFASDVLIRNGISYEDALQEMIRILIAGIQK